MVNVDVSSYATFVPAVNILKAAAQTLFSPTKTQGAGCE
jgi:hypothetical protein